MNRLLKLSIQSNRKKCLSPLTIPIRHLSGKQTIIQGNKYLIKPGYEKLSYAMTETSGLRLLPDTVSMRLNAIADEKPNDIAYSYCYLQQNITFLELKQRSDQIAQRLLKMGFKKGDRLAVLLPNVPQLNTTIMAAASIGVIIVLMNPAYQQVEIEYMLKKTGAKGAIILNNLKTLQHYQTLKNICPELDNSVKGELNSKALPDLKHIIVSPNYLIPLKGDDYKGTWNFNELEKHDGVNEELPHVDMDDPCVILFTSGTTGLPKGE
jgi:acyl-coenzyme A synthetase/AMP-(fatty) acid ligase